MYIFRLIAQYFEENYFSASLNANYENLNFTGTVTTLLMLVGGICLGVLLASFIIVFEKRVLGKFIRSLLARGASSPETALSLAELGLEKNGFIKRELSRASVSRKLISVVGADGSVTTYKDELCVAFPEFAAALAEKEEMAGASEEAEKSEEEEADALIPDRDGEEVDTLIPDRDKEDVNAPKRSVGEKTKDFFFEKKFKLRPIDFTAARFFIPSDLRVRAELRFREKGSSPWWLLLAVVSVTLLFFLCLRFIPAIVGMLDVSISNIKGN